MDWDQQNNDVEFTICIHIDVKELDDVEAFIMNKE